MFNSDDLLADIHELSDVRVELRALIALVVFKCKK